MTKIIAINGQIDTLRETLVSRKKNPAFPADLSEKDIYFQLFQLNFKKYPLFQLCWTPWFVFGEDFTGIIEKGSHGYVGLHG